MSRDAYRPYTHGRRVTQDQAMVLIRRMKQGDKRALSRLVEANAGLAHKIGMYYLNKSRSNGAIDPDDVVQASYEGLMVGLQKYDPSRGYQISTYVTFWIRKYVMNEIYHLHSRVRPSKGYATQFFSGHLGRREAEAYIEKYMHTLDIGIADSDEDHHAEDEYDHVLEEQLVCSLEKHLSPHQCTIIQLYLSGHSELEIEVLVNDIDGLDVCVKQEIETIINVMRDKMGVANGSAHDQ